MIPGRRYEVRLAGTAEWLTVTCERADEVSWTGRDDAGRMVPVRGDDDVREIGSEREPCVCDTCGHRCDGYVIEHGAALGAALGWQRRALEAEQERDAAEHRAILGWGAAYGAADWEGAARAAEIEALRKLELAMHWGAEACEQVHALRTLWNGPRRAYGELEERLADAQRCIALQERTITRLDEQQQIAYAAGRRDALAVQQHRSELERDVIEAAKAWETIDSIDAERVLHHAVRVLVEAERAK